MINLQFIMSAYSKKDAKIQFYVLFFAFLAITLFFEIPEFKEYFTGEKWITVEEVRHRDKKLRRIPEKVIETNNLQQAKIVTQTSTAIEVDPIKGWGVYFLIREIFGFVLGFTALWFGLRAIKKFQSEDTFESNSSSSLLRIGQILVFGGCMMLLDGWFINLYLLKAIGFPFYKIPNWDWGYFVTPGAILIYFSRYYKRGLKLQEENDLTV